MAGETDLAAMLSTLEVEQRPGTFTLVSFPAGAEPDAIRSGAQCTITETEGTTFVVGVDTATCAGCEVGFEAAWLTLKVHSALDAVGLTAAVSAALAAEAIPCNVLAGYYHDHLLVPAHRVEAARAALQALRERTAE